MKFTVSHVDESDSTHDRLTAFFKHREFAIQETSGGASKEQRIQTAYQTQ
jgi:hypothetical protein